VSADGESRPFAALLRRIDENPALMSAFRAARKRLPGDEHYGDPLSLSTDKARA